MDVQDAELTKPWNLPTFNLILIVYVVFVALCLVLHHMAPWGQFPVLSSTIWLAVETWSVLLLLFAVRSQCVKWGVKGFSMLSPRSILPPQQQMRRRTAKTTHSGQGPFFKYATCEMQGWRASMEDAVVCAPKLEWFAEDAALFGVFDGHGGAEVSAFVASRIEGRLRDVIQREEAPGPALKQTLLEIEDEMRSLNSAGSALTLRGGGRYDFVGCTAAVALLTRTALAVVNVGDSRIFKCRQGDCVPLTRDHKPESPRERRRIEAAGGTVVQVGPCYRIDCNLNLSRALGDFKYKDSSLAPEDQKVSPVGDVTVVDVDSQDEFVVIACDGLFELMTWTSVCSYVRERIRRGMPLAQIAEGLLDECCSPNMLATMRRGTDNETVIIVQLSSP